MHGAGGCISEDSFSYQHLPWFRTSGLKVLFESPITFSSNAVNLLSFDAALKSRNRSRDLTVCKASAQTTRLLATYRNRFHPPIYMYIYFKQYTLYSLLCGVEWIDEFFMDGFITYTQDGRTWNHTTNFECEIFHMHT